MNAEIDRQEVKLEDGTTGIVSTIQQAGDPGTMHAFSESHQAIINNRFCKDARFWLFRFLQPPQPFDAEKSNLTQMGRRLPSSFANVPHQHKSIDIYYPPTVKLATFVFGHKAIVNVATQQKRAYRCVMPEFSQIVTTARSAHLYYQALWQKSEQEPHIRLAVLRILREAEQELRKEGGVFASTDHLTAQSTGSFLRIRNLQLHSRQLARSIHDEEDPIYFSYSR